MAATRDKRGKLEDEHFFVQVLEALGGQRREKLRRRLPHSGLGRVRPLLCRQIERVLGES
jgi:hypothetical protein